MSEHLSKCIDIRRWSTRQLRLLFVALQFFTRLPIPSWVGFDELSLQNAARFFPLIGWIVAAFTCVVYGGASILWPHSVAVLLSVIGGMLMTGALHEDGFADVCDGFGGGMSAQRVLEIMKDSRIGVYGAIGSGLLLGLKCATLFNLPVHAVFAALLAAHPLSRLFSILLIWRLDYVGGEGKASVLARKMTTGEFLFGLITGIVPVLVLGLAGAMRWATITVAVLLAIMATLYLSNMFLRRIGGYTGDCLGAVQQVTEVGFYLGILACNGA
jgi:adenosylcobinamide-GDP ribazoletransferase